MSDPLLEPRPAPRPLAWTPLIHRLPAILGEAAPAVYLVGGVVRDAFWGRPAHDIDLVVPGGAFVLARRIADALGGAFYKLDPARETGRAIAEVDGQRVVVDVANFRGADLLADLQGRDFTLNAVAAPASGDLDMVIDPLGGLRDAQDRILRRCRASSIADDPIRALRAVRLSAHFGLRIEPATLKDIRQEGHRLIGTSPERVRDEFINLLASSRPAAALRTADALGLLARIVPEIDAMRGVEHGPPHQPDVWSHTLAVIEQLHGVVDTISPRRTDNSAAQAGLGMIVYFLDHFRRELQSHLAHLWPDERPHAALLMLAALLHDSGKPATWQSEGVSIPFINHEVLGAELAQVRGQALRLSGQEVARLVAIVRHHQRPHLLDNEPSLSRRAIYRFWRDCGAAGVDICLLSLADYLATAGPALSPPKWGKFLQTIDALLAGAFDPGDANVTALPPLVTGHDLMQALNLPPGPQIGELLERIREAQAEGEVHTTEEALALARRSLP